MNTEHHKKALEKELKTLEAELKSVGHKNPANPKDWEPRATDVDIESSDVADTADNIENYESNTAILKQLEKQYNDVKSALDKIKKGTYGLCEVDGKPIEEDRLKANPSARTCMKHVDQEKR
ncbi:MAG TPA: TraR/DksA C4-type zinc finger protein [Candidatus Paceibacterota bacterium]|nr:TraR/DksA C4-type zinc finger protein [Candidatus Paceibacterota bacterium]